jgi:hypothetical protein
MKKFVSVLAAVCLVGCGEHSEHAKDSHASGESAPPMHKDGEGILLCSATKDSIALKTAEVTEHKEGSEPILVAPKSAILETTAGASLYIENGERYKRSSVKVGRAFGDMVEITEGVYEGDKVVTDAAQTLWLIELRAIKGGKGCCPMPDAKGKPEKAGHAH